jgi:hypothetical protein
MTMNIRILAWIAALGCLLAGCATSGGWTPVVDTYGDPNLDRLARNKAECRELARQASGNTTEETLKGAAIGGLIAAAAGVAIGAAVGEAGTGAAVGAAAGGIGGGTYKALTTEARYKEAFKRCLASRGHKVIN